MEQVRIADRRDYVISFANNPIAISGGPIQRSVTLDSDYPWMWTGFYLGSIYSSTPNFGGFIGVLPQDLTFQLLDSNRNMLFSDFCNAAALQFAVTSSNDPAGLNRNEIFIINPEQPQPAGGSFIVYANNLNTSGTLFFELILTGYKVKDSCLKTKPPSKFDPVGNLMGSRL